MEKQNSSKNKANETIETIEAVNSLTGQVESQLNKTPIDLELNMATYYISDWLEILRSF